MNAIRRMRDRLIRKFKDPEYRHSYVNAFLNTSIAAQIRALRESRGWSQKELAEKIGTTQPGVSALENVNYSRWSVNTLRRLARAFDVVLIVKFESFGKAIDDITRFSKETALLKPSFDEDPIVLGPETSRRVFASFDEVNVSGIAVAGFKPLVDTARRGSGGRPRVTAGQPPSHLGAPRESPQRRLAAVNMSGGIAR